MSTRRTFVAAALTGLASKAGRTIGGDFVDKSHLMGHRLRDGQKFAGARRQVRVPLVIAGGGIAGLSAAWRLRKRGFHDFVLLEMEDRAGGNSRWGENEVSRYPWAAHYLPLPGKHGNLVRELMTELGVYEKGIWEERHLCHTPQERLFLHGRWQDGIVPDLAATRQDREQFQTFEALMREFADRGDFAIPMELGTRGSAELDRMTMSGWLESRRLDSPYLRWYVDYSCRDDFGSAAADTSAWAGVHYFAAREHASDRGPLTWPEGNGWIAERLIERAGDRVRTGAFVHSLLRSGTGWRVMAGDTEYLAGTVIFAMPLFLTQYLLEAPPAWRPETSPWLTANLTLDRWPRESRGAPMAWDNVIYRSPSLGYVVATHQSVRTHQPQTVWTYYWALAQGSPAENRRRLLEKDWRWWSEQILTDLEQAHPDIRDCVTRIDIQRMGHAMARPAPGFLTSAGRRDTIAAGKDGLYYAHADLSGFSLFEEAQFWGVTAADRALARLSRR